MVAHSDELPRFPYGAVYFRKSNPPEEDWARDYGVAAEDGMNTFRHWFIWSAIEVAPGQFDWADYDRQLDLAAAHDLKTIIAAMITAAPEWAFHRLRACDQIGLRPQRRLPGKRGARNNSEEWPAQQRRINRLISSERAALLPRTRP
jgi:beta-galactosidase GanA